MLATAPNSMPAIPFPRMNSSAHSTASGSVMEGASTSPRKVRPVSAKKSFALMPRDATTAGNARRGLPPWRMTLLWAIRTAPAADARRSTALMVDAPIQMPIALCSTRAPRSQENGPTIRGRMAKEAKHYKKYANMRGALGWRGRFLPEKRILKNRTRFS